MSHSSSPYSTHVSLLPFLNIQLAPLLTRSKYHFDMANNVDEDFEEEEVWATLVDNGIHQSTPNQLPTSSDASMIPCGRRVGTQSTAPVSIPDWSKIFEHVQGTSHGEELGGGGGRNDINVNDDEDDEGDPPHEWLAKKMAKTHISSSVCEGSGRTLKGRDLSKVRNAVLTKTGFLEEDKNKMT